MWRTFENVLTVTQYLCVLKMEGLTKCKLSSMDIYPI